MARGVDPLEAALLAELAVVVLHVALGPGSSEPVERPMGEVVAECFTRLRGVLSPDPARSV